MLTEKPWFIIPSFICSSISDLLKPYTDDLEDIKMTQNFASALFRARLKKEMEEKSKKKNSKRAAARTKKQQLTA